MLVDGLKAHRARIIRELREAMEFKAFTDLAYVMATALVQGSGKFHPIVLGFSDFASAAGMQDEVVAKDMLPLRFAKAKENYFFAMVHEHQVALFEHLFFDELRLLLLHQPKHLSRKKQIDYGTVLDATDKEQLLWSIVDRELNELKYKNVREWFEYVEKLVSGSSVSDADVGLVAEAKATRDILVHNAGLINNVYVSKSGEYARFAVGDRADVAGDYTRDVWSLFLKVLLQLCDHHIAVFEAQPPSA